MYAQQTLFQPYLFTFISLLVCFGFFYRRSEAKKEAAVSYGEMKHDSVSDLFFCNRMSNDDLEPLEWVKVTCKYANRKSIADFCFDDNYNICLICYNLQDLQLKYGQP